MAQQFELKKAATSFKKSRISKTGKLNEDKLWAYKITEDLFHQTQIVPQGKNHGILMFVDMSGSMHRQMKGTLEQMETMAMFCRRVNIPFDVYGFSDSGYRATEHTKEQLVDELTAEGGRGNFSFAHLLSSKSNTVQWNESMAYLQVMKKGYERSRYYTDLTDGCYVYIDNRFFRLGGTPLVSAMTLAPQLAKRFQKNYNVEKLTTIVLTDGDPTDDITYIADPDEERHYSRWDESKFVIKDGAATYSIPSDNDRYTNNRRENMVLLLEYYKKVTGSVLINFHLLDDNSRRGFEQEYSKNNFCNKVSRGYIPEDEWKETLARKFMRVEDDFGYSARFLIKGKGELEIKDEELEVKSTKKGDLLRGFRKFQKGKTTQRVFLNQIIELVA